jgi:RsiW-degrading membrane proteinase PrsW (M82 family)
MPIQAFFEGIIAALGALILELSPAIFGVTLTETSLFFILFTASVEEIMKYVFIYNHYLKMKAGEKILLSAIFIGLGFAIVDVSTKYLYFEKNTALPIAGILLVHFSTTALLGLFFWKKNQKTLCIGIPFIVLNILLHFLYNFLVLRYF